MSIKTAIKSLLAVGLVCLGIYLVFDLVSSDIAQKQDVQNFCTQKCGYNPSSLYWEFAGDNGVKGFTTKTECFSYCSKTKMGFAYNLIVGSYASLMSSPFVSDFLKLIHLK